MTGNINKYRRYDLLYITVNCFEVRYSVKVSSDKCDLGLGLELGLRLGLDSDFVIGTADFGIVNWNHELQCGMIYNTAG